MSVIALITIDADPAKFEEYAKENGDVLKRISEDAKGKGCLHHRFVVSGDGKLIALDEWENEEGFGEFFESNEDIPQVMEGAGATGEPQPAFYNALDTEDQF